jgi:hypothetical protein
LSKCATFVKVNSTHNKVFGDESIWVYKWYLLCKAECNDWGVRK